MALTSKHGEGEWEIIYDDDRIVEVRLWDVEDRLRVTEYKALSIDVAEIKVLK